MDDDDPQRVRPRVGVGRPTRRHSADPHTVERLPAHLEREVGTQPVGGGEPHGHRDLFQDVPGRVEHLEHTDHHADRTEHHEHRAQPRGDPLPRRTNRHDINLPSRSVVTGADGR